MPDAPDLHGLLTRCARELGDLLLSDIECLATFDFSPDEPLPHSIEEDTLGTRDRLTLARDLRAAGYPVTPRDAPAWWPRVMDGSLPLFPEDAAVIAPDHGVSDGEKSDLWWTVYAIIETDDLFEGEEQAPKDSTIDALVTFIAAREKAAANAAGAHRDKAADDRDAP